ncbi:(d)CMP kinase [Alterisphingorhabdus coralli]|uniref:Cytidylate kinase n=1 Tax=Alterisphingorhabdus coralli TaxID=3071408 RepID=A0AA97I133_9SPHN|nr:d(CMP) kinase [Parasphingorhabdus sp. SCSIO 66989]WOE74958.1 d(CMP) kinase [Parasphingorhabdus sp. SCSIO 66989]
MIIAVDGPSASGKGTIAKALAKHFGLPHLDTGLLYRAVGHNVALMGGNPDDPKDALAACAFPDAMLDDPVLRDERTGGLASRVSVHPEVRAALFKRQQDFAQQPGGAILDGRDIGTVIAPDADAKLFVTASVDARTNRRVAEMERSGEQADRDEIRANIQRRDARDKSRATAPLIAADDAHLLDTSDMTIDLAVREAIAAVNSRIEGR